MCIYVYIMTDVFKSGLLQLQKKNSLVPQMSNNLWKWAIIGIHVMHTYL